MPLDLEPWNGSATLPVRAVCNLYSITTNQAAIAGLFRVLNPNVGNLPPMPGVFPDYPAPLIRNRCHRYIFTELVHVRERRTWLARLIPDVEHGAASMRIFRCNLCDQGVSEEIG